MGRAGKEGNPLRIGRDREESEGDKRAFSLGWTRGRSIVLRRYLLSAKRGMVRFMKSANNGTVNETWPNAGL